MKNFENYVKNYSASEREGRIDESPAIINPAGSVSQDYEVFRTQPGKHCNAKVQRTVILSPAPVFI
jgi:hypothetical protein